MHIHKWSNWKRIVCTNRYNSEGFDMQERECSRCGKVKRKGMN